MDHGDANRFELGGIENFAVVEIVHVAVGDEIEIGAADGASGGQASEAGTVFENRGSCYAGAIVGKIECSYARGADSVLNGNEAVVVPVESVSAGEGAMRTGPYILTGRTREINRRYLPVPAKGLGKQSKTVVEFGCREGC